MPDNPIFVTRPSLPPLDEFLPYLEKIWDSKILTNRGPFHRQLEELLCVYLGVEHIALFANGTIALLTALRALDIAGEVITTPFSFVATTHSLLWSGIKPVFVDIDPQTLNLDPAQIEAAITPRTTAILPVHCYGNPCDVGAIKEIAAKYKLKVIYDAAHAFGVHCESGSLLRHGDLSVLSFHATKVFNTLEGGAIVCPDAATKQHVDRLKNFGYVDETTVVAAGINGKMNELQAALGILQLKYIDREIKRRGEIDCKYRQVLMQVPGIHCVGQTGQKIANYSYFPVLVGKEYPLSRDALYERLREHGIFSRRYFYPLISDMPMCREPHAAIAGSLDTASRVADAVLCLPIYAELTDEDVEKIASIVSKADEQPEKQVAERHPCPPLPSAGEAGE